MFFHLGHISLSRCTCFIVRGRALGIHQGVASQVDVLWHCMWGRGQTGNNATYLALGQLSVTSPGTHKQIGPFWCRFLCGCVCVHSRTLWVSPVNSPVRLGVSLATANPTCFYTQRFGSFLFPCWNTRLHSVSLHSCSSQFVHMQTWDHPLCLLPPCSPNPPAAALLHISVPISCLHPFNQSEWMLLLSLTPWFLDFHTVWFSDSLGYFLFFKFVVVLLLVVQGGKVYLPLPPSWPEDSLFTFNYRTEPTPLKTHSILGRL